MWVKPVGCIGINAIASEPIELILVVRSQVYYGNILESISMGPNS